MRTARPHIKYCSPLLQAPATIPHHLKPEHTIPTMVLHLLSLRLAALYEIPGHSNSHCSAAHANGSGPNVSTPSSRRVCEGVMHAPSSPPALALCRAAAAGIGASPSPLALVGALHQCSWPSLCRRRRQRRAISRDVNLGGADPAPFGSRESLLKTREPRHGPTHDGRLRDDANVLGRALLRAEGARHEAGGHVAKGRRVEREGERRVQPVLDQVARRLLTQHAQRRGRWWIACSRRAEFEGRCARW